MADDLSILLKAQLNVNESINNINKQILEVQGKLKTMNISLDVSGVEKAFKSMNNTFNGGNKNPMSKYKAALEDTVHQFKVGMIDLETYARRMEKIIYGNGSSKKADFFKLSNGDQEKYIARLNSAQADVQKGLDAINNSQKAVNKSKQDELNLLDKEIQKVNELESAISKKLNSLPKSAIGKADTNEMFALMNTSKTVDDLKEVEKLVDDYYKECIANEKRLNSEKTNTASDMQKAINQEESKLEYIRKQRIQILEIERQIANAKVNNGIDNEPLDKMVSQIRTELDAMSKVGMDAGKYEKGIIDDLVKSLQHRLNTEKDIIGVANKQEDAYRKIEKQLNKIDDITTKNDKYDKNTYNGLIEDLDRLRVAVEKGEISFDEFGNEIKRCESKVDSFSVSAKQLSSTTNSFTDSLKRFTAFYGLYDLFELGKRSVSSMVDSLFELDHALVELQKTSTLTGSSLDSFVSKAYGISNKLARTGTDVINASAEFSKAGFGDEQLANLAETALLLTNVGDGITDVSQASGTMISAMKGFGIEAENSIQIVDKINAVSNSTASNFEDIAFGLERMSGTLGMAGASIDETIGMFTSVNEVLRNAEITSSGLSSVFMRMRGLSEETGESVDGLSSKLGDLYKTIGVNMVDSNGQLRDTFDVLSDLSKVWDTLTTNQKQYFAQESAGVRQSKVFITLMEQFGTVNRSIETSLNSSGSAMQENEKFLDSLEGKVNNVKSAFEQLAATTINSNFIKGILDFTASAIKLTNTLGGMIPILSSILSIVVAIKSASISSWASSMVITLGATAKAMVGVKVATQGATVAATGLQAAFGWIGIATMALSGLYMGMNYLSESTERAEQKVAELGDELNRLNSDSQSVNALAQQYEELKNLSDAQGLNNEQQQRFYDIQTQLKELLPSVNGYYDSQGQFLLDNAENMDSLIKKQQEYIDLKRLEYAEASRDVYGEHKKDYDVQKNKLQDLIELKELQKKLDDGTITYDEKGRRSQLVRYYGSELKDLDKAILETRIASDESLSKIRQDILNVVYATDVWKTATDEQKKALQGYISSAENIEDISKYLSSTDSSITTFINGMDRASSINKEFGQGTLSTAEHMDRLSQVSRETGIPIEILKDSMFELAKASSDSTDETDKQAESFENLKSKFDALTSDVDLLNDTLENLNKNHQLSAKEISSLADKYPQLLQYLGDEEKLRQQLQAEIVNTVTEQEKAYTEMLMASEGYYNSLIQQDTDSRNELLSILDAYNTSVGEGHQKQLEDFKTLEEFKITATANVISQLGKLWQQYFNTLSAAFGKHGFDATANVKYDMTDEQWSKMSGLQKSQYQKAIKEAQNSPIAKMYDDMYKQFEDASKTFANFTPSYSGSNTSKIPSLSKDKKSGGSKSGSKKDDLAKQIKDQFDKAVAQVQKSRDQLDAEISKVNTQIELFEVKGDTEKVDELNAQLTQLLAKRTKLTEQQNIEYRGLQQKFKDEESLAKLEKLIADNSEQWYEDRKNHLSHENALRERQIELIQQQHDLELAKIDDRSKQLDLIQALYGEDSEQYKKAEKEKFDFIIQQQEMTLKRIQDLKAMGLKDTDEIIQKEKDMYYDLYNQQIQMAQKAAEKKKQAEIDSAKKKIDELENQKKAIEELTDLTMDMIRKEQELKKQAIQDEIDGYQKIINKKKESLREEKDDRSYQKGLKNKEDAIKKTEDKILALSNDGSKKAQAEKAKLEEELRKLKEDLEDYQYENSLQKQEDALDKEFEAFKDEKQKELDTISDYLSKEGKIREDALKLIESKNKDLYDKLKKYNAEYGNLAKYELEDLWDTATSAIEDYSDSNESLLSVMQNITKEMEKQKSLLEKLSNMSWQNFSPESATKPNAGNNGGSDNKNLETIQKMKDNSAKWAGASKEERKKLEEENKRLGTSIGAYYDSATGVWYVDSKKTRKLFDSIGIYHTGGIAGRDNMSKGIGGVSIDPRTEVFAKLMKGEPVITQAQAIRFMDKSLPNLIRNGSGVGDIKIDKFVDITVEGNLDTSVDIEGIVKRASKQAIDGLMNTLSNKGITPRLGF